MVRIRNVEPTQGFKVRLTFTDGGEKTVDLEPYLRGPIFEPVREDRHLFLSVKVDPEFGTIVWPNGADMDPDVLHAGLTPAWMEQEERRAG